ncbi:putative tRNAHis guanylyltransferase [Neoconidiobolus thromboides FSU 785]|nr:putative tRNAHis guanylyltransferase [Neoconidiobolus thromboides FSU 785]
MAKSKYEYVRDFEQNDSLLKGTFIVIRIDGQAFHKFTTKHSFTKPNDDRGINLMNKAALEVMRDNSDIFFAYGQSDEYSFVFKYDTEQYDRRASKLISTVVSKFTSNYTFHWNDFFPTTKLNYPPSFDGRAICYPSIKSLKDYLSWRQVDCHINNLYNYCFWKLVESGVSNKKAQEYLKDTVSSDKNELLFTKFNINYSKLPEMHRKGSVIFKPKIVKKIHERKNLTMSSNGTNNNPEKILKLEEAENTELTPNDVRIINNEVETAKSILKPGKVTIHHIDIISKKFWDEHNYLLPEI